MSENDSLNPPDWYAVGKRDLKAAQSLLRDADEVLAVSDECLKITDFYTENRYMFLRLLSALNLRNFSLLRKN